MNLVYGAGLRLLHFCFLKRIIARAVSLREQLFQTVRRLAGGPVKIYVQICLQTPADLKSAGNRGVVHDRLQMLHVHVFLAAPLGARHMAQPSIASFDVMLGFS